MEEDPRERLMTGVSLAELERRWNAVREMMRASEIDYLVMRADEEFLGGYVRWFTDIPARNSYPVTVIFPVDAEMTRIACGASPPSSGPLPEWAARGIKRNIGAPFFTSLHYTFSYDADLAVEVLAEKKMATIGLVGKSNIPINFFEYLSKHLPGSKFVDSTDLVDQIKAVKSPEEIKLIKQTAELQDNTLKKVTSAIRPGRRDFEVFAEAQYAATMQGSTQGIILVGSGSAGTPVRHRHRHFQNRLMREGDQCSVLIEVNGPGGFYTEIERIFSIGEPSQELQDAYGVALEAQKVTLNLLNQGAAPKDIWDMNNEFLEKKSYFPEKRLYAHGQGYDLVERPAIRYDETMKIRAGMNLTVHPSAANDSVWAGITDNYLVTENGVSACLHRTPKKIIVV